MVRSRNRSSLPSPSIPPPSLSSIPPLSFSRAPLGRHAQTRQAAADRTLVLKQKKGSFLNGWRQLPIIQFGKKRAERRPRHRTLSVELLKFTLEFYEPKQASMTSRKVPLQNGHCQMLSYMTIVKSRWKGRKRKSCRGKSVCKCI